MFQNDFVFKNMLHLVSWIDFGWIFWSFHSSSQLFTAEKTTGSNPFGPQFLRSLRRVGCGAVPTTHPSLHGSWVAMGMMGPG